MWNNTHTHVLALLDGELSMTPKISCSTNKSSRLLWITLCDEHVKSKWYSYYRAIRNISLFRRGRCHRKSIPVYHRIKNMRQKIWTISVMWNEVHKFRNISFARQIYPNIERIVSYSPLMYVWFGRVLISSNYAHWRALAPFCWILTLSYR